VAFGKRRKNSTAPINHENDYRCSDSKLDYFNDSTITINVVSSSFKL
jgi:hypothetical protein